MQATGFIFSPPSYRVRLTVEAAAGFRIALSRDCAPTCIGANDRAWYQLACPFAKCLCPLSIISGQLAFHFDVRIRSRFAKKRRRESRRMCCMLLLKTICAIKCLRKLSQWHRITVQPVTHCDFMRLRSSDRLWFMERPI